MSRPHICPLNDPSRVLLSAMEGPLDYASRIPATQIDQADDDVQQLNAIYDLALKAYPLRAEGRAGFARILERVVGSIRFSTRHLDIFAVNSFYLQDAKLYEDMRRMVRSAGDFDYLGRLECLAAYADRIRKSIVDFPGKLRIVIDPVGEGFVRDHEARGLTKEQIRDVWVRSIRAQAQFFESLLNTAGPNGAPRRIRMFIVPTANGAPQPTGKRRILATDQEVFCQEVGLVGPGLLSPTLVRWIGD